MTPLWPTGDAYEAALDAAYTAYREAIKPFADLHRIGDRASMAAWDEAIKPAVAAYQAATAAALRAYVVPGPRHPRRRDEALRAPGGGE